MKYALVILDVPPIDGSTAAQLSNVVRDAESVAGKTLEAARLNIGCWLIPLDNGANDLGTLVTVAKQRRIPHRILFLDDPSFVVTKI